MSTCRCCDVKHESIPENGLCDICGPEPSVQLRCALLTLVILGGNALLIYALYYLLTRS